LLNIILLINILFLEAPEIQIDDSIVVQLVSMGFNKEGCRKAVYHTKNQGKRSTWKRKEIERKKKREKKIADSLPEMS